jgi:hypothetical protein
VPLLERLVVHIYFAKVIPCRIYIWSIKWQCSLSFFFLLS